MEVSAARKALGGSGDRAAMHARVLGQGPGMLPTRAMGFLLFSVIFTPVAGDYATCHKQTGPRLRAAPSRSRL